MPSTIISPFVGEINCDIIFNKVVFPPPLGPTIATISPSLTSKLILSKTLRFPNLVSNDLESSFIFKTFFIISPPSLPYSINLIIF